jgi:hypothetical protein
MPPIADAYVAQTSPTTPFGATDPNYLITQGSKGISGPCSTTRQAFLKFDLSLIPNNITTATLKLQNSQGTGVSGSIIGIWGLQDDSWQELTVTWNTRPVSTGAPLLASVTNPPVSGLLQFPSTSAFVNFINSQRTGDGIATIATGFVDCAPLTAPQVRNTSKESTTPVGPPLLNLAPVAGLPTETPTNTAVPVTDTPTNTAVPPTDTPTNTAVPPTDTATNTPVPPTDTSTNTRCRRRTLPPTPRCRRPTPQPIRLCHQRIRRRTRRFRRPSRRPIPIHRLARRIRRRTRRPRSRQVA